MSGFHAYRFLKCAWFVTRSETTGFALPMSEFKVLYHKQVQVQSWRTVVVEGVFVWQLMGGVQYLVFMQAILFFFFFLFSRVVVLAFSFFLPLLCGYQGRRFCNTKNQGRTLRCMASPLQRKEMSRMCKIEGDVVCYDLVTAVE